jgi:hypothetical protein
VAKKKSRAANYWLVNRRHRCGCFGAAYIIGHSPTAIEHGLAVGLARDIIFIMLAAGVLILAQKPPDGQGPQSERPSGGPATALGV